MKRPDILLHEIIIHARQRSLTQADSDSLTNLWANEQVFLAGFILHAITVKNNSIIDKFIKVATSMDPPASELLTASSLLSLISEADLFIRLSELLLEKAPCFLVACNIKCSLVSWLGNSDPRILSIALKCEEIAPDQRISAWIDKLKKL